MPHPHAVIVLLSTFNGEKYLAQQLDSLYQQTFQEFSIIIRDDGSTDQSVKILKQYAQKYSNVTLLLGTNIGVINSFFYLLNYSPSTAYQYYAFCDQDDIWKPDKLATAVRQLNATQDPAATLFCSRLSYTDAQLKPIGLSPIPHTLGFENALIENVAIGCTMVFGEKIKQIVLKANPEHMMMHDWWAYLVASAFGNVIYNPKPTLYYRQHANNLVGWDKQGPRLLKKSAKFLNNLLIQKNGLQSVGQAEHFLATYPSLSAEKQKLVCDLVQLRQSNSLFERYHFLKQHSIRRTHPLENILFRLAVLAKLH